MEEAAEIQQLISAVVQSGGQDVPKHFNRYKSILTKYQEQPQLLDGSLESIVQPLAELLRRAAVCSTAQDTGVVQGVCRMLHVLISVRGYKTVVRFFPHEAADLERVLQVLGFVTDQAAAGTNTTSSGSGLWEAQAVLLLWLSILILIPFDLVILDSSVTDSSSAVAGAGGVGVGSGAGAGAQRGYPPLAAKVMALCQGFLSQPGAVREMAALLLARLLTRPDMPAALSDFIAWQQQALTAAAGPAAVFLLPGVLQTLAQVYKLGRREQLLQWAPLVWQQLAALLADDVASGLASNALARKLAVKLTQRVGLVMLPPQLAGWRYVRAAEDMATNLAAVAAAADPSGMSARDGSGGSEQSAADAAASSATPTAAQRSADAAAGMAEQGSEQQQEEEEEALPDIPAEIEDVLGVLLGSCSDRDTVVRWSAAKGVGRLAGCLPCELAEEVVQGVLGLLSPAEPDTSWHGGCLAIAELARRSILSPDLLSRVAALLTSALTYDVRRGPHSVGAHVRDAAAYVCWALARSYDPRQLSDCVHALSASLLVITCYDREVNCRRAAAAAFQECVGRLGSFPHGLEVLAVADYYSVGNMASAYLRVAPFVAQYEEYTQALLDHLLLVKLRHWDKAVRTLAAMGLAALAPVASAQLRCQALPLLLQLVTDDVLEVRCGAVLAVAEVLPALAAVAAGVAGGRQQQQQQGVVCELDSSVGQGVVQVLDRLEAGACYKGKGGELMREMAARLVQQVAAAAAGLQAAPLYGSSSSGSSSSSSSSRRHQAELDMEHSSSKGGSNIKQPHQQQGSRVASPTGADADDAGSDAGSSSDDADDTPEYAAPSQQQQQQRRPELCLPLTQAFHTAAVRLLLDCTSHAQESIQAAGVAALRTYACAFQCQQQQQLLQVVDHCCRRLLEREGTSAARRGAAAAMGVMPGPLLGVRAQEVLGVLVSAVQEPLDPVAGFSIEARIAAVNSLSQLTQELIVSNNQQQQQGQDATAADTAAAASCPLVSLSVLQQCVLPALLAALRDYSRDNRGDVGSWVREAAMDGTTQLLLLLGDQLLGLTQQQQQQQQEQGDGKAEPAGTAAAGGGEAAQWSEMHRELALQLVRHLLQQSLERIARLRESALINLRSILQQQQQREQSTAAMVPGAGAIAAALPGDAAELAGVASLACVSRLGVLLQLPWYRSAVLEGLVASIGGVDASLAKEASAALLAQVGSSSGGVAGGSSGGGGDEQASAAAAAGSTALRSSVAELLLQLWRQEAGSARLSLPLIKTAALLITHADLAGVQVNTLPPPTSSSSTDCSSKALAADSTTNTASTTTSSSSRTTSSFAWGVLQQLKTELKGCGDVVKLLEGVGLLAQLACIPDCCGSAMQTVMVMLVNRYPKVRRAMAEQLYLQMLAVQSDTELELTDADAGSNDNNNTLATQQQDAGDAEAPAAAAAAGGPTFTTLQQLPADDLEAALDMLLISAWDGPLDSVRASREELAAALHVEIKTRRVARVLPESAGGASALLGGAGKGFEQESYQSLLDDAARGGGY